MIRNFLSSFKRVIYNQTIVVSVVIFMEVREVFIPLI